MRSGVNDFFRANGSATPMSGPKSEAPVMRGNALSTCYLCGAESALLHPGMTDRIFGSVRGEWNLRRCLEPTCGLLWLDPMPVPEDLGLAYRHYYTHGTEARRVPRRTVAHRTLRPLVRGIDSLLSRLFLIHSSRHRQRRMFLPRGGGRQLLEVGCGSGRRLMRLQRHGWNVTGQDVDPAAAAQIAAKGLRVLAGPLDTLRLPAESFDAIVMNHVIEHVYNPVELMSECGRLLKPGGLLVSITPNTKSWGAARFGRDWMGLDVPRHLYLYSPLPLERLAIKSGFERHRIWTTPAKASSLAMGSMSLARFNRFDMHARAPFGIEAGAVFLQYWALFAWWRDRGCGDESVLSAER